MRKTGNKWMTVCCGRCGKAHSGYTGKLDKNNVEYVVCEETHKRMDVSPIIDSTASVRYQVLYPTKWVLENDGLIFAGCGSAFTTEEYFQSNAIVESNGKRLLIDCGSDIRFALGKLGLDARNIDAAYISHLHADHIGGMEYLAFVRYFTKKPGDPRPLLFCVPELMKELWENSLRGGLESIEEKVMNITDYFECHPVPINNSFLWEGIAFTPVQTVHIMSGYRITHSYGLMLEHCTNPMSHVKRAEIIPNPARCLDMVGNPYPYTGLGPRVFFTTDTQFCPNQITKFYQSADLIFHDTETAPYYSKVHAHYDDLKTLPADIKKKMWLYHYQPKPPQDPKADGFLGFVQRGQEFDFPPE